MTIPSATAHASPIPAPPIADRELARTGVRASIADVAPAGWEPLALMAALALSIGLYSAGASRAVSLISPIAILAVLGTATWRQLSANSKLILTPLMGYRIISIALFGVGSLLPVISTDHYDTTRTLYFYSDDEGARIALLWLAACALTIGGAWLAGLANFQTVDLRRPPPYSIGNLTLLFYSIGLLYFVFVSIPFSLGVLGVEVPAPVHRLFEAIYFVGIFLLALWSFQRGGWARALLAGVVLLSTIIGLVTYSKSVAMMPLFIVILAVIMRRTSILRLALSAAALLAALNWIQPAVMDARILQNNVYGDMRRGSVTQRLEVFFSYYKNGSLYEGKQQPVLARLAYVESATYVMSLYDTGNGASTMANALVALVPRAIWRDKPILTAGASDLFYKMSGQVGSSTGTTIPPDIYFNFGYTGIVLLCPLMGFVFSWLSLHVLRIIEQERWFLLPAVFIAFMLGLAQDDAFVTGFFLPLVVVVLAYFTLLYLEGLVWRPDEPATSNRRGQAGRLAVARPGAVRAQS